MTDIFLFLNLVASVLLFTNTKTKANIFLGFLLLLNVLQGFAALIFISQYSEEINTFFFLNLAPISFLIGPCLYFYTKKKLNPAFKIKAIQLGHLIPFLFFYLLITPYLTTSFEEKIQTVQKLHDNAQNIFEIKLLLGKSFHLFLLRPLHILVYVAYCIHLFAKNKSILITQLSPFQTRILIKWMHTLLYSLAIIHACNLINMLYLYFTNVITISYPLPLSLIAAVTLARLSLQIYTNPYILYGFKNIRFYSNDSIISKMYKSEKNSNQQFSESWKNEIIDKIESIEEAKKFTEKGYNLTTMALDLDIPKYQLSHYFKEISDETFSEWKNRKRILFAVDLIEQDYLSTFTVEKLSLMCGYKSRANFNIAFKEVTKKKLSEYVKTC